MVQGYRATVQRKRDILVRMDPNYMPQPQQNPYDFLNAQPTQQKRPLLGGNNPKQRMLISVLFVLGVLFAVIIAIVVFRSVTAKDYSVYKDLVLKQTEIIRIADQGAVKARDANTKNYAATIKSVTQSEKNETLAFVGKVGLKINDKQLALAKDTDNDKTLSNAESSNQYDQAFTTLLNELIVDYQKNISAAADGVSTKTEKAIVTALQYNATVIANAPK